MPTSQLSIFAQVQVCAAGVRDDRFWSRGRPARAVAKPRLTRLAAADGRLLQPGDAQPEPLETGGIRRAIASLRVDRPLEHGSIGAAGPSA